MKKYVEIDETVVRTYIVEVEDNIAQTLLENNDAMNWYNDITLKDLLDYRKQGTLLDEETDINYASLIEDDGYEDKRTELYYNM